MVAWNNPPPPPPPPFGMSDTKPSSCLLCLGKILDPLCHHSTTCKRGGDVTTRHNRLRNTIYSACHRASSSASLEAGSGCSDGFQTRLADILVTTWGIKGSATFDVTVIFLLYSSIASEAGVTAGVAARAAEMRKHEENDAKCSELGWMCVPLAVESYGAWGVGSM